ncbi:hypothetical protein [Lentilactobacillus kisonensis]|uniref:Uncharacterized protein n=1 Tax=Lentilactobacillus kisonensis F0435 TaxID=797516 RepID=H1LKP0_9LACO|nr:hypothetical protein [Lentilactobacillus kisonensis]EHO46209.1 hypothetical protein HMPREF9104_03194 [Lentilactobacillus kisonensis F0435]
MPINQALSLENASDNLRYDLSQIRIDKSIHELVQMGKANRDKTPFEKLAKFKPVNRDVVQGIQHVEHKLISELLPLRHKRLAVSAFSFLPWN